MLQVRRCLDLRKEPLGSDNRSEFRLQDFECGLPLVLEVVGKVDRGHPALTDLTLDAVSALESCVQAGDGVGAAMIRSLCRV